ncbi:unnamed protein product [Trichogramma brassicae]|uniref:Uncharacterized protein n=1 Tax=Trichogramma brassicae TaxID=86971 RepID=A0A6H5IZD2_9HYME|nr:unnamed protein product [Trichogramma brassicae]
MVKKVPKAAKKDTIATAASDRDTKEIRIVNNAANWWAFMYWLWKFPELWKVSSSKFRFGIVFFFVPRICGRQCKLCLVGSGIVIPLSPSGLRYTRGIRISFYDNYVSSRIWSIENSRRLTEYRYRRKREPQLTRMLADSANWAALAIGRQKRESSHSQDGTRQASFLKKMSKLRRMRMPAMCDHAAYGSEKGDTTIDDGIVQVGGSQVKKDSPEPLIVAYHYATR